MTLEGYDATHRLGIQFDNVLFDDPAGEKRGCLESALGRST